MASSTRLLDEYKALLLARGSSVGTRSLPDISSQDVLIVVDMQNDFVPMADAPDGGRFSVPEGATASKHVVKLIDHFSKKGAKIVASLDYHPDGHISFIERGGPFPSHCVQGSPGSRFFPPIGKALKKASDAPESDVHLVHKGFHEDIESFGAFPYKSEQIDSRPLSCADRGCCPLWTGGFELKCSNRKADINAPPDILSILEDRRMTMKETIDKGCKGDPLARRIFVCGLAMDFCCLDTLVNAAHAGYRSLFLVMEATRAAHIPGLGKFGSGFLTDPAHFAKQLKDANCQMVSASSIGLP